MGDVVFWLGGLLRCLANSVVVIVMFLLRLIWLFDCVMRVVCVCVLWLLAIVVSVVAGCMLVVCVVLTIAAFVVVGVLC